MYTKKKDNAKNPTHRTASLSGDLVFADIEMVKIFEKSLAENTPYLIDLNGVSYDGWVKRRRKYWEEEKGLSITYHALTKSVWVIPMQ